MSNPDNWIEERTILKVYRGSHSYGTNHADSDVDLGGVCIPPKEFIIGLDNFEQWENKHYSNFPAYDKIGKPAEVVIYSVRKFIQLACNCNPNIIEHLFVAPQHIVHCNKYGNMLINHRHLFLTKKARDSFGGYAYSQLRKLTNKLPMEEAKSKLANIGEKKRQYNIHITKLEANRYKYLTKSGQLTDEEAATLLDINTELNSYNEYIARLERDERWINKLMGGGNHGHHGSHKNLIEKYGFDVKHALHLIRLLRIGLEILVEGECRVLRPDNKYLLDIRHGKYTLEQIQAEADRLFKLLDEAYVTSKLPEAPDVTKVNKLLEEIILTKLEEDRRG